MNCKILIFLLCVFIEYSTCSDLRKKHVVIIVADDLGWNDVSFHGSNQFITPNIDALAYSGIILHNYYVMPLCSPSRSALMTGIHPIRTGMYHEVLFAAQPTGLPLNIEILPQYLKGYGYKTHAVGKWHLGFCKEMYTPTKRGFDSHFGYWTAHSDYYNHTSEEFYMLGKDFRRNMDNVSTEYLGQYATDLFTTEAVNIINSHNTADPLFLYLAHLAVHSANSKEPLQAPKEIIEKFSYIKDEKRRTFAAMTWKLDESVGKVVQALAQKNMLEDTIIVFTTDNGGPAGGFNLNVASNWPMKGGKDTLWEGGVRGAAFIWSTDLPHSGVNNALMHIQDWLPTILGAIDEQGAGNVTQLKALDGRNMWPVLKGDKQSEYDEIILQRDEVRDISALRKQNWKLIQGVTYKGIHDQWYGPSGREEEYTYNFSEVAKSPVAASLQGKFPFPSETQAIAIRQSITLSCDYCGFNDTLCTPCDLKREPCLFNITNDPCEKNNLAKSQPNILKYMLNRMKLYNPVRPLFPPIVSRADPKNWNDTWTNWMDYPNEYTNSSFSFKTLIKKRVVQKYLNSI